MDRGNNRGYGRSAGGGYNAPRSASMPTLQPKRLPENYVDAAEQVIRAGNWQMGITTSKIRRLFSLLVDLYHEEVLRDAEKMLPENVARLRMAQVRMLYEAGRDPKVKAFVERAELVPYLKAVGDNRAELLRYFHYMEALVAYHKYFGGREG